MALADWALEASTLGATAVSQPGRGVGTRRWSPIDVDAAGLAGFGRPELGVRQESLVEGGPEVVEPATSGLLPLSECHEKGCAL